MDANFGLCRRKAAGNSVHPPLSGTEIFFKQSEVDDYVAQYQSQGGRGSQVRIMCIILQNILFFHMRTVYAVTDLLRI